MTAPSATAPTVNPADVVGALRAVLPPSASVVTVPTSDGTRSVVSEPGESDVTVIVGSPAESCGVLLVPVVVKRGPLSATFATDPGTVPGAVAGAYARLAGRPTCRWCGRGLPFGSRAAHCDRSCAASAQNAARAHEGSRSRWE